MGMQRRRERATRLLRVLLACAVLAVSAAPRAGVPWTDAVVLVVRASAPSSSRAIAAPPRTSATSVRLVSPGAAASAEAPSAPLEPAATTDDLVLVPRLYLRKRALLC